MTQITCKSCRSSELEYDHSQGNTVCTRCGSVLEENIIVSEITFSENAAGASVLQGQFVSSEKGRAAAPVLFGSRRYHQSDSREQTLSQARSKLQSLAHAVQLSDHHVDSAHRWFILALQHNFTRGRKSHYIAASCLYLVCRQEKTSHMLLDFSDVLQVNVFELGSVYLKLSRLLNVQLPILDPSLYIGRFAARLEFGDKTQIVANTALRLVSRMKRDWIQIGRRPSGICGACLLIAARIYGFKRTQKEIIHVVRICDMTLRRRLNEFADTPSSQLTPEQFHGIWLEKEADPPAFTRNKLLVQQKSAAESLASDILSQSLVSVTQTLLPSSAVVDTLEATAEHHNEVEVNLEDMDHDIEVIGALLENHEIDLKTQLWMEANKDFLLAQEEKNRIKLEEEKSGVVKVPKKKRKTAQMAGLRLATPSGSIPSSASEATKQLLQSKKLSKKFNYDVLDSLLESQSVSFLADYIDREASKSHILAT